MKRAGVAFTVGALLLVSIGIACEGPSSGGLARDGFPKVGELMFIDLGASPARLWGSVDCASPGRVRGARPGGHMHIRPPGGRRDNRSHRRLRIEPGDYVHGQRCEVGLNDHRVSPVALYHEGQRRITFASFRLPQRFPLHRRGWQVVMQMKQTQPSNAGGGRPMLALHVFDGRWRLIHQSGKTLWSAPARGQRWVRFAFDVVYSVDPGRGLIRVHADLNGDGDARDRGERSAIHHVATLKRETAGTAAGGLAPGDPIPSHLRTGLYQDPAYPCGRRNCAIGVDNVAVYGG